MKNSISIYHRINPQPVPENRLKKNLPKKSDALTVMLVVLFIYPLINLLRGQVKSFSFHSREILFFLTALFVLTRILYFIHSKVICLPAFREKVIGSIITEFLLTIIYTPVISATIYLLIFPGYFRPKADFRVIILFTIILFLILAVYLFYYNFSDYLTRFRKAIIVQEKLNYENITIRYKALQNHISPHFIFNCLSSLDALITSNPPVASEIVHSLSECMRHILTTIEKITVPLDKELEFVNKYLNLLDIRMPGYIILKKQISEDDKQKRIPPYMLQILIENVSKHNTVSPGQKLCISIKSLPDNKLEVSNRINKKYGKVTLAGTGTGLNNILQHYSLLTDEKVSVSKTEDRFTVILPLLEKGSYEYTDY